MSRINQDIRRISRILRDKVTECTPYFQGQEITPEEDRRAVHDAYYLMWLLWFDLLEISPASFLRTASDWFKANPCLYVDLFDEAFSVADELLLHAVETDLYPSYAAFLRAVSGEITYGVGALFAPIKPLLVDALHHPDAFSIFRAHQSLVFISRLTLRTVTKVLSDEAKQSWVEADGHVTDEEPQSLCDFFHRHFKYFTLEGTICKHGPGNVFESTTRLSILEKYKRMTLSQRDIFLLKRMGLSPPFVRFQDDVSGLCRLAAVPKACRKRRVITIESIVKQWLQHGIRDRINDYVRSSPHLSRHIDIEDDSKNAFLALNASKDGRFSTIDLSAASDSVLLDTVRLVLPAQLRTAVLLARSGKVVLDDGSTRSIYKYGGMGNATTFIIETLVFAAIVEQGIREAGGDPATSRYRVHGDDIIVETKYVENVIFWLQAHGFKINHLKTFTGRGSHIFRESCGMEALDGWDITPLRLPRKGWHGFVRKPVVIQGLIDLCNRVPRMFKALRLGILDFFSTLPREQRPEYKDFEDNTSGLSVAYPSNTHLYSKYLASYQATYVRHGQLKQFKESAKLLHRTSRSQARRIAGTSEPMRSWLRANSSRSYISPFDEWVRYYEYLRVVSDRKRLLYPEDRVDVNCDLPDYVYWGSSLSPNNY